MSWLQSFLARHSVSTKLSKDLIWNTAGFGVMGAIGLLLHIVIAAVYGGVTLGVFNQVYAVYILGSQFAAWGIHHSVLRHASESSDDAGLCRSLFLSALILVTTISAGVSWGVGALGGVVAGLMDSPAVGTGIAYVVPGLFLFAVNKVCLARINAHRHMRAFAVFQAGRFVLYLGVLILLIAIRAPGDMLPVMFSVGEAVLFVGAMGYVLIALPAGPVSDVGKWCRRHLSFGTRAAGGNVLLDVNTRVDVLILGLFVSDMRVGVYSFAAILADGFNQLPVVLRTNVNPIITQTFARGGVDALQERIRQGVRLTYRFLIPLGLLAVLAFPLVRLVGVDKSFMESWWLLGILMGGCLLAAGYVPFQMVLSQAGHPGSQTCLIAILFVTNVILNMLLIPRFGVYGAAVATAVATGTHALWIKTISRKVLGIHI